MRKLNIFKKYKHFKNKEYLVLGVLYSSNIDYEYDYINVQHTELEKEIKINWRTFRANQRVSSGCITQ